jgi:hypothetical protein
MTTPYGITTSIGSQAYSGYLNTPITGPLSTNNYPNAMPYHSYGVLTGQRPTPPQFFPSQEPVNADMSVNSRAQYLRATDLSSRAKAIENAIGKASTPVVFTSYSSQRQFAVSSHVNYISPIASSMFVNIKKSIAIGKSAYKVGLQSAPFDPYSNKTIAQLQFDAPISTKSYYPSGTRSALQRARSSGCTAPKKKGSIYNTSLRPMLGSWGALPRQGY